MDDRHRTPLSELTTLRLGGPARRLIEAGTADELVEAVACADARGEPVLLIAGGSNLVISDDGFDGTVIRIRTRGVGMEQRGRRVRLAVAAGEPWDELVMRCVADGLAGVECLSGIPGSTGATPIQNVGAYGQEVAETISAVHAYDRQARAVVELTPATCRFAYRSSALKGSSRYVVLGVAFELERSAQARPVRYRELAEVLDVAPQAHPPLSEVREAVLALRRAKGMVIDPADPDSVSAGSFFLNPIITTTRFAALERRMSAGATEAVRPPAWPHDGGRVKTSAAWLIEHAGFHRGYGDGRAGISRKHTLALVNRGGATTAELVALARELRDGVLDACGVALEPEPTLIGVEL